jgi:hypothetical protein
MADDLADIPPFLRRTRTEPRPERLPATGPKTVKPWPQQVREARDLGRECRALLEKWRKVHARAARQRRREIMKEIS